MLDSRLVEVSISRQTAASSPNLSLLVSDLLRPGLCGRPSLHRLHICGQTLLSLFTCSCLSSQGYYSEVN